MKCSSVHLGFLLLIDSIQTAAVQNKENNDESTSLKFSDDDQEELRAVLRKLLVHADQEHMVDDYPALLLAKQRLSSRGVRLPSESILLGKRRLPVEAVLLGRRNLAN